VAEVKVNGEARKEAKDAKILEAAKALFLELGFEGASMDLVAQQAASSKTTLYSRYPSKAALFIATLERECARRGVRFPGEPFDALPIEEALRRMARIFVDIFWSPEVIRLKQIVESQAARFPEIARAFMAAGPARGRAFVADYLTRAKARGAIDVPDPRFAADQFLLSLHGMTHLEMMLGLRKAPSAAEKDAFVARATALFLAGLRPR
jgi:TetR/AcrR family transcriptional regulator, mexJK operon transcriptional repressor